MSTMNFHAAPTDVFLHAALLDGLMRGQLKARRGGGGLGGFRIRCPSWTRQTLAFPTVCQPSTGSGRQCEIRN